MPCKVGDTVKATVLRPFDNHTVHIIGEVIAIRKNKKNATIRVKYNGNRIIDFYDTDFGDTIFVIKKSDEREKSSQQGKATNHLIL